MAASVNEIQLGRCFSKSTKLETLNVRNLPQAETRKAAHSWLPLDVMYERLARFFLKIVLNG